MTTILGAAAAAAATAATGVPQVVAPSVARMPMEAVPAWVYQFLPHSIVGLFVFAFGACLGSFVNVLVHRLPEGISVVSPPSRCPRCGIRLGWRENLPVIGWMMLRGRCRACRGPISMQYPAVEALVGSLCLLLYLAYFASGTFTPWWSEIGGFWFAAVGPLRAAPLFTMHCLLIAALVAMTLIDARLSIVTLEIPVAMSVIAFVIWPLQGVLAAGSRRVEMLPLPLPDWPWLLAAVGATVGLVFANLLVRRGAITETHEEFEIDLDEPLSPLVWTLLLLPVGVGIAAGGMATEASALVWIGLGILGVAGVWGALAARRQAARRAGMAAAQHDHGDADDGLPPRDRGHAIRLVARELLFLMPALLGAGVGWFLAGPIAAALDAPPPLPLACLGGSLLGYLVGGGVIWAIRLAGTAGFGREAMGLGDVHLLASVGAVLGWIDPIGAVVLATVSGIVWAAMTALILRRWGGFGSAMPFGPHLAVGCLLVVALRPGLVDFWHVLTAGGTGLP